MADTKVTISCAFCHKEFRERLSHAPKRKYCSIDCRNKERFGTHLPFGERFSRLINKTDSCWLWTGHKTNGYGMLAVVPGNNSTRVYAHRLSYMIHFGPIPDGLVVCHKCDNPPCVNPDHFFIGTKGDNTRDCARKGRTARRPGEKHHGCKLTDDKVREIRRRFDAGERQRDLVREFGTSDRNIHLIVRRKSWKHIP